MGISLSLSLSLSLSPSVMSKDGTKNAEAVSDKCCRKSLFHQSTVTDRRGRSRSRSVAVFAREVHGGSNHVGNNNTDRGKVDFTPL